MRIAQVFLIAIILVSVCAPVIAPYNPRQTSISEPLQKPGRQHLMGTDALGRDVFSRVLYGGRKTLGVSITGLVIAAAGGFCLGFLPLLVHRRLHRLAQVTINSLLALPPLVLALVIITLVGQGTWQLALAVGCAQIAAYAQITRLYVTAGYTQDYIIGAMAAGASRWRIMTYHILPNALPGLLAYAAVVFSYNIINSAALSFLGLGGDPGIPDWGVILAEGRNVFQLSPWIGLMPGLLITVTVLSANTLADNLTRTKSGTE